VKEFLFNPSGRSNPTGERTEPGAVGPAVPAVACRDTAGLPALVGREEQMAFGPR
jgi:hypothetical protein